jgi:hypothetical protein
MISNAFRGCLTYANLALAANPSLAAGVWAQVGEYTVPDGTAIALGFGAQQGQDQAQGRIYLKMIDDTAGDATEEPGMLRLELRNPRGIPVRTLFESRSEALSASTDRTKQLPFPELNVVATEGWKLALLMKADAADIVQMTKSVAAIDCTFYDYDDKR